MAQGCVCLHVWLARLERCSCVFLPVSEPQKIKGQAFLIGVSIEKQIENMTFISPGIYYADSPTQISSLSICVYLDEQLLG